MIQAYVKMWKNFANFKGRASRADYWWAYLANLIVSFVIGIVAGIVKLPILTTIYMIAILIPSLSLAVRRLHDTNRSGWTYLLCLIPIVGTIIVLVFFCLPSVNENNRYNN